MRTGSSRAGQVHSTRRTVRARVSDGPGIGSGDMAAETPHTPEQDASGPTVAPARAATGVEGFDGVLGGGLLRRRMYVIEGAAGAGKTTLALHFMLAGRANQERGLWI